MGIIPNKLSTNIVLSESTKSLVAAENVDNAIASLQQQILDLDPEKRIASIPPRYHNWAVAINTVANLAENGDALRRQNGTETSNSPFFLPYNARLIQVVIESGSDSKEWAIEIFVNGVFKESFLKPQGEYRQSFDNLDLYFNRLDRLSLYLSCNGSVEYPGANFYFMEELD